MSALFAALTGIFAKLGVVEIPSQLATLIRTLVVVALAACLVAASGEWHAVPGVSPRGWAFLVLSGLATGASWLCWFRALSLGDAARVAPIDKLSVVILAAFGVFVLGEKLSSLNWLGIALITLGAVLVAVK